MGTSTWREMGSPFTCKSGICILFWLVRSSLSLTGAAYLTLSCSNDAASEEKDSKLHSSANSLRDVDSKIITTVYAADSAVLQ
ncbi:hypothetical protein F442_18958 [Phytophthora nicotianae P10297]|uniref:Uncharacterized protein n=1 Tax=Phytophthora nicotianae P10297 TaxID=1317064 RepID=W2YBF1_PHYNI|nr:hypothetical protein F442_18958 [Phytophthora nicotianae P10297]